MIANSKEEAWEMIETIVGGKLELDAEASKEYGADTYKPVAKYECYIVDYETMLMLDKPGDSHPPLYIHIGAEIEQFNSVVVRIDDDSYSFGAAELVRTMSTKNFMCVEQIFSEDDNHILTIEYCS